MSRRVKRARMPPRANWRSFRNYYFMDKSEGTVSYTISLRKIERVPVVPEEKSSRGKTYIRYSGYLYPIHDAGELQEFVDDAKLGKFIMRGPNMEDCSYETFERLPFICDGEKYRPYFSW